MLNRYLARFFYGACALAALTSCGDSKAGGTGEFATVFATANSPGATFDSDVTKWVGTPCGSTSSAAVAPDAVVYTITSTPYAVPNTGSSSPIVTSDLIITKVTLTLNPDNDQVPALPARFQSQPLTSGQRIVPGTNNVSVRIASDDLKVFLISGLGAQSLDCNNQSLYKYRATVSFEALEVTTNRVSTITAPGFLLVNFADFPDT